MAGLGLFGALKQYWNDASPGGSLNPEVSPDTPLLGLLADPVGSVKRTLKKANDDAAIQYGLLKDAVREDPKNAIGVGPANQALQNQAGRFASENIGPLMFIGKGAKVWDALAAKKAEDLASKGVEPRQIWSETGTWKGPDGQWRQEIPDNAAKMDVHHTNYTKLPDFLDHKSLYDAYPSAQDVNIKSSHLDGGTYRAGPNLIEVQDPAWNIDANPKSLATHELQHWIQNKEGWAQGGGPEMFSQQSDAKLARDALSWRQEILRQREQAPGSDIHHIDAKVADQYREMGAPDWIPSRDARDLATQPNVLFPQHYPNSEGGFNDLNELVKTYGLDNRTTPYTPMEAYQRLAGEAEARATQSRLGLDAAQRRAIFPEDSYDVPINQLIMRRGDASVQNSIPDWAQKEALRRLEAMRRGENVPSVIKNGLLTTPEQQSGLNNAYSLLTQGKQPPYPKNEMDLHIGHIYDSRLSGELKPNGKEADYFDPTEVMPWLLSAGDDSAKVATKRGVPSLQNLYKDPATGESFNVSIPISGDLKSGRQWVSGLIPEGKFKKKKP